MTDDAKPINGADPNAAPTVDQPEPPTELQIANARVTKFMQVVANSVAQTRQVNLPALMADNLLQAQQIRTLVMLLIEKHGLDSDEFNRRLGERCAQLTADLLKPQIAIAVADSIRPKR